MCNIISQLFTCCNHRQFQNIYQCPLITAQVEVQSNGNYTSDLFFRARVVPDRVSSFPSSSSRNTASDSQQNLRTMLILCERCPNLRRPSRPVGGYCRDCRRSHYLRNGLGASGSYGSRLGGLGGWGELPPLPRVDLTPHHSRHNREERNDNGNIIVGDGLEGVDQRSASELAGLARLVAGALEDDDEGEHGRGTPAERGKNKDGSSTGRRLRRKLRGKGNDPGNLSTTDGRRIDTDKKGSISSSSDHTSGSSATLIMGMTTMTMAAVGGISSRRGQGIGFAI